MEREGFVNSALSDHHHGGFVNVSWDKSMERDSQFSSELCSIVSSPSNPTPTGENVVIRELIGRLGSICNSSEVSPQFLGANKSPNTSCYSPALNSPPKLGLSMAEHHKGSWGNPLILGNPPTHLGSFAADSRFPETAARFSSFSGSGHGLMDQFAPPEVGKLSRVSSSKSLKSVGVSQLEDGEAGITREESCASDQTAMNAGGNARKRKASSRGKPKETTPKVSVDDSNDKKSKSSETKLEQTIEVEGDDCEREDRKESNSKPDEPPKQDYIHVRARRGQATDSHSLAERVRREKISERMKFLQDLVPGCNKVTGKAVMLDEIINYVQSLQRQVEFLSMKLSTVNPQLDTTMENITQKDIQMNGSLPHSVFPAEISAPAFPFSQNSHPQSTVSNVFQGQFAANHLDAMLRRPLNRHLQALDGFGDAAASLIGSLWDDDLQSVVQMGFAQNQDGSFSSQPFHGALPTAHMKVEL